jgi:hypothetical protein
MHYLAEKVITGKGQVFFLTEGEEQRLDLQLRKLIGLSNENYENYKYHRDTAKHERSQERVDAAYAKFANALARALGLLEDEADDVFDSIDLPFITDVQCPFGVIDYFEKAANRVIEDAEEEPAKRKPALDGLEFVELCNATVRAEAAKNDAPEPWNAGRS